MLLVLRHNQNGIQTSSIGDACQHTANWNLLIWEKKVYCKAQLFEAVLDKFGVFPVKQQMALVYVICNSKPKLHYFMVWFLHVLHFLSFSTVSR